MTDEQILAAIVQAAMTDKRIAISSGGGFIRPREEDGNWACCAISAGALYAGCRPADLHYSAVKAFAAKYGVSNQYAIGVSDGFEGECGITNGYGYSDKEQSHPDYIRGWAVGSAVASAVLP